MCEWVKCKKQLIPKRWKHQALLGRCPPYKGLQQDAREERKILGLRSVDSSMDLSMALAKQWKQLLDVVVERSCRRVCSSYWSLRTAREQLNGNKLNCVLSVRYLHYAFRKMCCSHYRRHIPDEIITNLGKNVLLLINGIEAIVIILAVHWSFSVLCHWRVSTNTADSHTVLLWAQHTYGLATSNDTTSSWKERKKI